MLQFEDPLLPCRLVQSLGRAVLFVQDLEIGGKDQAQVLLLGKGPEDFFLTIEKGALKKAIEALNIGGRKNQAAAVQDNIDLRLISYASMT